MRHILLIFFISIFVSCGSNLNEQFESAVVDNSTPIDTLELLTNTYWNLLLAPNDSNYNSLNKEPFYFYGLRGSFNEIDFPSISLSNDTLFFNDTSYISSLGTNDGNKVIKTQLIVKIEKIDSDTLVLKKIKGWKLPFYINEILTFYNDTLDFRKSDHFNKISFSSGLCYGKCPQFALEIDDKANFKFLGKKNSKIQGYQIGTIDKRYISEINTLLNQINIDGLDGYFPVPIDAPKSDIVIHYNDSLVKRVQGDLWEGPPRFRQLLNLVYESYLDAYLDTTSEKLKFETTSHVEDEF